MPAPQKIRRQETSGIVICYSIYMVEVFIIFILGVSVGSFLNVLIDRLPREESFLIGRSYCESCKTRLRWYDLIPIFSFVILKAKCRYCRSRISYYYPVVELTTGFLFVAVLFLIGGFSINFITIINLIYYLFIMSGLIVIFFTDLKYGIIPDKVIYPAVAIASLFLIANHQSPVANRVFSAIGAFLFFLLIFLVTRGRGMGFGDVKLAFLIGLILGFPKIVVSLYVAFLTGALVSIILILGKKKKFKGSTIPFGPFLAIGTLIALFWGDVVLQRFFPFL